MRCQREGWIRALTVPQGCWFNIGCSLSFWLGKKNNKTFCCHERSEIWSKLGGAGEGHVSFTAIFNFDMKDAVLVSQMFEKSRKTTKGVCKVAKMGLMV